MIIERFDIEEFNKHQKNREWNFTDKEENRIRQIKHGEEGYIVEITNNKEIFTMGKYFYPNGILAQKGLYFWSGGFNKGIWTDYDERGNIVEQTDYDAPYKNYPWEKIKAHMESKGADLLDPFTHVSRENENNHPMWYISWLTQGFDKSGNQMIRNEEIDGNTGKVLLIYNVYYYEPTDGIPPPEKEIIYDANER
ncbi:hypothetical protein [Stenoxybacter acetivorans]|uniref:hypothetical protein n=1 Tax=Stenoxybacter acetivorans TaxID=422441 RepID=UPI00069156B2|nr:hypothetical protein [Stenoxybacter acetivorans]